MMSALLCVHLTFTSLQVNEKLILPHFILKPSKGGDSPGHTAYECRADKRSEMLGSGELNYVVSIEAAPMQAKLMVRVTWYFLPSLATVGNRMRKCLYSKVPVPSARWGPMAPVDCDPGVDLGALHG